MSAHPLRVRGEGGKGEGGEAATLYFTQISPKPTWMRGELLYLNTDAWVSNYFPTLFKIKSSHLLHDPICPAHEKYAADAGQSLCNSCTA